MSLFKSLLAVPSANDIIGAAHKRGEATYAPDQHDATKETSQLRGHVISYVQDVSKHLLEPLEQILSSFRGLLSLSPFHRHLVDILFDFEHFKLALTSIEESVAAIDAATEKTKMQLVGVNAETGFDSHKESFVAVVFDVIERLNPQLLYLQTCRASLQSIPPLDPNARTLMLSGFPNAGKSTFINKVCSANVDILPFISLSMNLFLGTTDYKYLRWQVVDAPGVLTTPYVFENRPDSIDFKLFDALNHINSVVVFFVDLSETCGVPLKTQCELLHSQRAALSSRPFVVALSKSDLKKMDQLDADQARDLSEASQGLFVKEFSNLDDNSVLTIRQMACDHLLEFRAQQKLRQGH